MTHKPNSCWKCHDWVMVDIGGRMVATYCEECLLTVTEWIELSGASTPASTESDKNSPPEIEGS